MRGLSSLGTFKFEMSLTQSSVPPTENTFVPQSQPNCDPEYFETVHTELGAPSGARGCNSGECPSAAVATVVSLCDDWRWYKDWTWFTTQRRWKD